MKQSKIIDTLETYQTSGKLMEQIKQQINQVNRPFGKKYTTRLEHEHRKVKMISVKLKLPMKAE